MINLKYLKNNRKHLIAGLDRRKIVYLYLINTKDQALRDRMLLKGFKVPGLKSKKARPFKVL
jgi:hypothetical protein